MYEVMRSDVSCGILRNCLIECYLQKQEKNRTDQGPNELGAAGIK